MNQLMLWSICWKDPRFEACFDALVEHGIVGAKFVDGKLVDGGLRTLHFTDRVGPAEQEAAEQFEALERQTDDILIEYVRLRTSRMSNARACAEVAAAIGHPANSFEAAVADLRRLSRKSGK
jgi:hypothetical protein